MIFTKLRTEASAKQMTIKIMCKFMHCNFSRVKERTMNLRNLRNYRQKREEDDVVDSDFSIDENDEPVSDGDEDARPMKRRKVITKSYTEPSAKKSKATVKPKPRDPASPSKSRSPAKVNKSKRSSNRSTYTVMDSGRISVRKSTALKTSATQQRVRVRTEALKKKPKVSKEDDWIPTQEELLEEALITAEENLASLGSCVLDIKAEGEPN